MGDFKSSITHPKILVQMKVFYEEEEGKQNKEVGGGAVAMQQCPC